MVCDPHRYAKSETKNTAATMAQRRARGDPLIAQTLRVQQRDQAVQQTQTACVGRGRDWFFLKAEEELQRESDHDDRRQKQEIEDDADRVGHEEIREEPIVQPPNRADHAKARRESRVTVWMCENGARRCWDLQAERKLGQRKCDDDIAECLEPAKHVLVSVR
jgi:hypothetical protein